MSTLLQAFSQADRKTSCSKWKPISGKAVLPSSFGLALLWSSQRAVLGQEDQGVAHSALEDPGAPGMPRSSEGPKQMSGQAQVNHISDKPTGRWSILLGWGAWEKRNVFQGARLIHLEAPSILTSAFTIWLSHSHRLILGLICWYLHHWGAGSCTNKGQCSKPGVSQDSCSPRLRVSCGEQEFLCAPGALSSSTARKQLPWIYSGAHNPAGTMESSAAFSTNPQHSYFRPIILQYGIWWAVPPGDFTFSCMTKRFYLGKSLTWLKCWSFSIKLLMSGSNPLTFSSGLLICAFSPLETTLLV